MLNHIYGQDFDMAAQFLDTSSGLSGETISSLLVMGILVLLSIYVAIRARFADPLKKPKGILFLVEVGVTFFDGLVESMMGKRYRNFGGFIMAVAVYLFLAFIFSLTGLPSPSVYLATPLSLGLIAFVAIHINAMRFNKWKYFKRFIEPIPVFLPVNLISMWAPLLSLTMRLFGNALAGWTLMTLVYSAFNNIGGSIIDFVSAQGTSSLHFGSVIAPFITPVLHAYFDLFSGLIQTVVFMFLTMIFVANEGPEDDDTEQLSREGGN